MTATTHDVDVSCRLAYEVDVPSTMVFSVAASQLGQQVVDESWWLDTGAVPVELAGTGDTRLHRVEAAPGPLELRYEARVRTATADAVPEPLAPPHGTAVMPMHLELLRPSRFAQSDLLGDMAVDLFGLLAPGADQALALRTWINQNIGYVSGSTGAADSALDTVQTRQGVCRDFVHVGLAFARALQIPARYVSAYAPLLQPPDFHAVLEVQLGGRWWVLDPTGLAPRHTLVRIGTGRDAADCAFATILDGHVEGLAVEVSAVAQDAPPQDDHTGLIAIGAVDG